MSPFLRARSNLLPTCQSLKEAFEEETGPLTLPIPRPPERAVPKENDLEQPGASGGWSRAGRLMSEQQGVPDAARAQGALS